MGPQYVGLPTAAKNYALSYLRAFLAFGMALLLLSSLGALLLNVISPNAMVFYLIALASVTLHLSAIYVRDVWDGEYDPGQAEFASASQLLAHLLVFGISQSALYILGAFAGVAAILSGLPFVAAAALAAYYPVVDVVLFRNGYWTPSGLIAWVATWFVFTVINVPSSLVDSLPVIWKRNQKQHPA